jgi:cell division cycle 2-like protein
LRLGDGDLGDRDRLTERERVSDRGVTERRGDTECAERGRVSDLVRDLSREGLRVRERAGDGERDGMLWIVAQL